MNENGKNNNNDNIPKKNLRTSFNNLSNKNKKECYLNNKKLIKKK